MQFTSDSFTATEASGMMTVGLVLSGGEFDRDITVSVTTMELQSSATGEYLYYCELMTSLSLVPKHG